MNAVKNIVGIIVIIGVVALAGGLLYETFSKPVERVTEYRPDVVKPTVGAAPAGLRAAFGTTSQITVGPNLVADPSTTTVGVRPVLFVSNSQCQSRVISTVDRGIYISYGPDSSATVVGSGIGHYQATSTTFVYDASVWGCGNVSAWALASTSIRISEFR
jgi:hypothetical protein